MDTKNEHRFARSRLPWLVAAGAVVVYLLTLDRSRDFDVWLLQRVGYAGFPGG